MPTQQFVPGVARLLLDASRVIHCFVYTTYSVAGFELADKSSYYSPIKAAWRAACQNPCRDEHDTCLQHHRAQVSEQRYHYLWDMCMCTGNQKHKSWLSQDIAAGFHDNTKQSTQSGSYVATSLLQTCMASLRAGSGHLGVSR